MSNILDVDPSILERNLLFKLQEDDCDMTGDSLFNIKPKEPDDVPWKPVKPSPGYCVKLRTQEGDKVFVNVCHMDAIPEPAEISEEKLLQMIMDDDVPSFRVPISIGDLHIESDKSRNPCSVYDIAVNSKFFKKMDTSEVFNTFFLNISIQALQEKYSLNLDLKSEKPFLLLKNRKVLGNLQIHRIQQREVKKAPGQLIQEIDSKPTPKKNLIEIINEDNKPSPTTNKSISNLNPGLKNKPLNNIAQDDSKVNSSCKSNKDQLCSSISSNENKVINQPAGLKKPLIPEEKGIQECRVTKHNPFEERDLSTREIKQSEEPFETKARLLAENVEKERRTEEAELCSSLFCLKQFPEVGVPELLVATVHLNVKSSKDFDLQLDDNRLNITLNGKKKPWFDIYLPYNIDVNTVEACFILERQKLMIKMDVVKT